MAAIFASNEIAPDNLKFMLLAYGMGNAFRVVSLEDIAHSMPHIGKELIRKGLDCLADESLVTKFSGRYCFNRPVPNEVRRAVERAISPSGTVRYRREA
ncbi:MAG TPA: hypothetical protein VKA70_17120 [Blastocatellia bacterium]|nr:hypothetical protein [Blastocatellia bacterium]